MPKKFAKKSARKRAKKSEYLGFGLVINGSRTPLSIPSMEDAQAAASGLVEQGCKVAIYNQDTNKIVKRL
jgi:hypothetical protein